MVDTLSAMMARRAKAQGGAPAAPATPAPAINSGGLQTAAAPSPPAAAPEGERPRAPWHVEGCTACKDNKVLGFSTKGTPCRICNNTRAKAGQETADAYEITPAAEGGQVTWKRRDGAGAPASAAAAPAAPAKVDKPTPPAEPAPAAAAPSPPAAPPAPAVVVAATPPTSPPDVPLESDEAIPEGDAPAAAARGRGRPKAGFTLLVNCRPGKGFSGRTLYLSEILAAHMKVVEQHPKFGGSVEAPKNFWSLNAFDRRDALVQQAPAIAEALGTSVLVVDTDLLEARAVLDALRGFPCREVVGLGR